MLQCLSQSMVESLLYAAMAIRPDIAQAASAVSKFNANPDALKYEQSDFGALIGFSDAEWAGD